MPQTLIAAWSAHSRKGFHAALSESPDRAFTLHAGAAWSDYDFCISGCLPTDSGHLLAGCDNRSPRAPKGSLPALDCTPVAREGVQIDQGVLLPE